MTYGKGGWFGIVMTKESTSNAKFPMHGHMFHDIGFEGLEIAVKASYAEHNSFIGGSIEQKGVRKGIDLDPVNCSGNKFVGLSHFEEQFFCCRQDRSEYRD